MIQFISEQYLRENTVFNQNLDIKDIVNNLDPAADIHIMPALGLNFYNQLLNSYSAQTLTVDEQALVMQIKPALAYHAAQMALPFIQYQIKNKGPQTQSGDNSASVDDKTLNYLRNELKNRAEFYMARLVSYLQLNASKFPGFVTNNNTDVVPDLKTSFDSGFALYPTNCNQYNGNNCNRNPFYS